MLTARRLAPLAALLLAAALLALALRYPAARAVDVGAPGDAFFLASMYRPEGAAEASFRWTGPGSRLLVPAAYDGPLALELRLHAAPFAQAEAMRLRIVRNGATVAELATTPSYRVYRLLLPPDAVPEPPPLRMEPLDLAAPPAYAPGDARPLGVALAAFSVAPAPGRIPLAPILGRALSVAWGLGLLVLAGLFIHRLRRLRRLPAHCWPQERARRGGSTFYALRSTLYVSILALWAWRDPLGFAWAVPTPPWWLLLAVTAGVALWWWGRAGGWRIAIAPRIWLLLVIGVGHLLLLAPLPWAGLGALIVLLLPGALAAWALFPEERSRATLAFVGLCGALSVAPMLLLALHALPGPLPAWLLLVAADGLSVANAKGVWTTNDAKGVWTTNDANDAKGANAKGAKGVVRRGVGLLGAALLVAVGLRLWHLGGAEFQGDEARAMLLAAAVAHGDDALLLTHTKGPVEALLPAGPLALVGTGAEWVARLPFALASIGVLLGALALLRTLTTDDGRRTTDDGRRTTDDGRRTTGYRLSAIAAISLLAVDGFAVGFGRIVQYQSIVMLMMTGAFWCCWRFYAGAPQAGRQLVAAAVLLAVGLLAHYDAVMVVPALAWLVVAGGLRRGWRAGQWLRGLAAPVAVGATLLVSFFVPYLLGPSFASTAEYLAGRAGEGDGGGPPFNNLPLYLDILAFYNAPPLVPLLVLCVLGAVAALLVRHVRPRPLGIGLAVALGLAALAQWLAPQLYGLPGGASWAGLAFGVPLLGLCAAPAVPAHVRGVALWFATALCAEAFLIAEPRTHFYTAHVPAALLVGLAVAQLPVGRRSSVVGRLAATAAAVVLVGGGLYAQLVFLRQFPEYQRVFPAARPELLRARYGDALPEAGYFGFPHRDGWKAAAELFRAGALQGSYDTNQNRWLAGWYLQGLATQCKGQPALYLIAEAEASVYYPPEHRLEAVVLADPVRAMAIYGAAEPAGGARSYSLEELAAAFDARPVPDFPVAALLTEAAKRCE